MATAPTLFYESPEVIYQRMKTNLAAYADVPAIDDTHPWALALHTVQAELVLQNAKSDSALAQSLVAFANAPQLDYLGSNQATERLVATPATCTLRFFLTEGHAALTIPAKTRVRTTDGKMIFATDEEVSAGTGITYVDVTATAQLDGPQGNEYIPGLVVDYLETLPFIVSVTNTDITAGGADTETNDNYRNRIMLGQNRSGAGSRGAYKYRAASANPGIIDVSIDNLIVDGERVGGTVVVYPLYTGGAETPQAVLDAVMEAVKTNEESGMLNDIVTVVSPDRVDYTIPLTLILKSGAVQSVVEDAVITAISVYCTNQAKKLGADVTESQIVAAGMNGSVHSLKLIGFDDIIVDLKEFAVCTQITKVSTSYEDINA